MDDLENRLHDELDAAGRGVGASDSIGSAVRRKVRRRQARAGALAALPVALLVVGALWVVGSSDDAADVDTFQPNPPSSSLAPVDDPLRAALVALGADVDGAPAEAVTLGDAEWCGVDRVDPSTGTTDDEEPSGCLIDATGAGRDAAMVRVETTIEGDPIVNVVWTRGTLFDAPVFIDSTQDAFGRPGWTELRCDLTVDDAAPVHLTWRSCVEAGTDPLQSALSELGVALAGAPEEAVTLDGAQWCGVDSVEEPNLGSRRCLWDAWQTGAPAVGVLSATTIEGAPLVEVHRVDAAGLIIRWVDATRDPLGSRQWEGPWYCDEFDVVDGEPVGANDCDNVPPVGSAVPDQASTDESPIELDDTAVTTTRPGQAIFFGDEQTVDLFLVSTDGPRRWAHVGEATRNSDGTTALAIGLPRLAAREEGSEFPLTDESDLPPGRYRLVTTYDTDVADVELLTDTTGSIDLGGVSVSVDSEPTPLLATGIWNFGWGSDADAVIESTAATFGPVLRDEIIEGCPTLRTVEFTEGLTLFFGDGLDSWAYDGTRWSTEEGIRVGSELIDLLAVGARIHGGYDANWGGDRFQLEEFLGGTLSHDRTHPDATVDLLVAGRDANPVLQVC
ncbi:MAG: hypothetical protein R2707_00490 [Acidimicrobiales bacterium]